jgi:hypothetical protein
MRSLPLVLYRIHRHLDLQQLRHLCLADQMLSELRQRSLLNPHSELLLLLKLSVLHLLQSNQLSVLLLLQSNQRSVLLLLQSNQRSELIHLLPSLHLVHLQPLGHHRHSAQLLHSANHPSLRRRLHSDHQDLLKRQYRKHSVLTFILVVGSLVLQVDKGLQGKAHSLDKDLAVSQVPM